MRIVNIILSRIVGWVFIFSSLSKIIAIRSFTQTVDAFISLLGINVFYGYGMALGFIVCSVEFLLGIIMLHKMSRQKAICSITFFLLFFIFVTYINLTDLYGGFGFCSYFGENIHMTTVQTFYESLLLLGMTLWMLFCFMRIQQMKAIMGLLLCGSILSCTESQRATYIVDLQQTDSLFLSLLSWEISDTFPDNRHRSGVFTPRYGMMDFREVYDIAPDDTSGVLGGRSTDACCHIQVPIDTTLYLRMDCAMPYALLLGGDTLRRKDISGLNIYALPLREGQNELTAHFVMDGDDLSFEATLCDSLTVGRIFADGQSGNIVYALVNDSRDVLLTNAHQNVLDAPVTVQVHDVAGQLLKIFILQRDTFVYPVHEMEWGKSYMFSMTLAGRTVRQPVLCGKDDDALVRFQVLLDSLPAQHPRRDEITEVLFRLDFLLHHPSRYKGDWWWQFKIPTVTYQLEHAFAHLDADYGAKDTEPNIVFVSYRSTQDDSLQHYLLARPNRIEPKERLPLVVVIRPCNQNLYHFFSSPQLARQWAVNQLQAMAERFHCLILMPEMRTQLGEDITSRAEREFHIALQHVQDHYPVDTERIYLHANCSGGYRALKIATMNPGIFRAIGLYAPVYHCPYSEQWSKESAPELHLRELKGTPMFIQGDPLDTHSPYSNYKDLIDDSNCYDIPLTLMLKRNSGKAYNVVLVGIEAMEFILAK